MEYKFRAIYKPDKAKIMFYLKWLEEENDMFFVSEDDPELRYPMSFVFHDDDWIVEQGIGQADKNGKELFQGDKIMNMGSRIGIVLYYDHMCYYNVVDEFEYNQGITGNSDMINNPGDGWMLYECEKIGTIHD